MNSELCGGGVFALPSVTPLAAGRSGLGTWRSGSGIRFYDYGRV